MKIRPNMPDASPLLMCCNEIWRFRVAHQKRYEYLLIYLIVLMQLLYFVNNLLLLFNDTGPSGTFCNIPSEFVISINISIIVPINPRYQHNTAWQRAVVALSAMPDTAH